MKTKLLSTLFITLLIFSCSSGTLESKDEKLNLEENSEFKKIEKGSIVASNGKYLCVEADRIIIANRDKGYEWETFKFVWEDGNKLSILSYDDYFVSADFSLIGELVATRKEKNEWESFTFETIDEQTIAIKASNGKYLTLNQETLKIIADSEKIGQHEQFKIIEQE